MSCKGKTGKALTKCMSSYVKNSKNLYPRFNQLNDTIISTTGNKRSAVKRMNSLITNAYNPPGPNSQKTVSYTDGTTVASTITKKRN
tara:strand:- start:2330 stop:2590 length:261 start_codon:yes stop_codon:yes gene_type:complete